MPGIITKISGPTVVARDMLRSKMYNLVFVGEMRLIGEVIRIEGDRATIQVYEETGGLTLGGEIVDTGGPLCAELGPGLLSSIFDGIQRPLAGIANEAGSTIPAGVTLPALDRRKRWDFIPMVKPGSTIDAGDVIGTIEETAAITHRIMVPAGVTGILREIRTGEIGLDDTIAILQDGTDIRPFQRWPVRRPRPFARKMTADAPFITGQRVIDTLFPVARGGSVIIPGGFGTGKTVLEQTLAKFARADIIIYIGCGERGNEIAEVLTRFPGLNDPYSGHSLMERTLLIVNTSNMPVAAREASIYTGITIGEYYRDMGYDVAILADSVSRWAEAMREISGRLEELPGEEGFPMYLASRLAAFYERAGMVECIGQGGRKGSVTVCTAISPPGGDFSEPVTQSALRVTGALWALDTHLARRRHFPAIHWGKSFSLYRLNDWFQKNIAADWLQLKEWLIALLQKDEELQDLVQLVGLDALQEQDRVVVEMVFLIRENYLQQSPYSFEDAFCPLKKQYWMLKMFFKAYESALSELSEGRSLEEIFSTERKVILSNLKNIPGERFPEAAEEIIRSL